MGHDRAQSSRLPVFKGSIACTRAAPTSTKLCLLTDAKLWLRASCKLDFPAARCARINSTAW